MKNKTTIKTQEEPAEVAEPKEQVLCIPKKSFNFDKYFKKSPFLPVDVLVEQALATLFASNHFLFVDREKAEHNPDYKQIIPYVCIQRGNEWCVYQRTKKSGESRLHDKWSIGFGGHVNPVDSDDSPSESLKNALIRELDEELGITPPENMKPCGLLYDGSDDVGRVHMGFVYKFKIANDQNLTITDPAISNAKFEHRLDIKRRVGEFEKWSQCVINEVL